MQQAHRLLLIKEIMILSKQMNCGLTTSDFKGTTLEGLQEMYRDMSENVTIWLEVFGTTF
jgi:hypothetical protein